MPWQVVRRGSLWIVGLVSFLVISCATITVNVYFPQKEVKSAFKSLEEELLQLLMDRPELVTGPKQDHLFSLRLDSLSRLS